jgi:PAS domain S-box-containing protein
MTARGNPRRERARTEPPAQALLDHSERRIRDFAEAASDWFWEIDRELCFTYMSDSVNAPTSAFARDFLGKRITEVRLPGLDQVDWAPLLEIQMARRPFRNFRLRRIARDGAVRHLSLSGVPIFDAEGGFLGYRGIGRDITAEVAAEARAGAAQKELGEKTQLLQATLENIQQGLMVIDHELRIKAWNDRVLALLDVPRDAVCVGRPIQDVTRIIAARGEFGPCDLDAEIDRRMDELRRLDPPVRERRRPDGTVIELRHVGMPDGGFLITYTDITERKRVEADLRRARDEAELASRSKTEFLANMSHELRTPLNAVIGFADVLSGEVFGPLGDHRYQEYAGDIRDSGLHLLTLINDVLDVAKIEHGTVDLADEILDADAVVHSCVRLMRERAAAAGVTLAARLAPDLPALRADRRRLKEILINLLSNAVKFTPAGGQVTVAAAADERGCQISVIDTGIGIAAEDIETALRPFGQIDSRLARRYQGTGLGLPLAKAMAELHGGGLELESAPGRGTTATLRLPLERVRPRTNSVPG